jgi:formate hydrogenlyase transcriptional activator
VVVFGRGPTLVNLPTPLGLDALSRYEALLSLSRAVARHTGVTGLLCALSEPLHLVVPFDFLMLVLHDAPTDEMRLVVLEPSDTPFARFIPMPLSERGPAQAVWETQRTSVGPLQTEAPRTEAPRTETPQGTALDFIQGHGARTVCWLPLTTAHRRVGILGFGSRDPERYGADAVAFMEQVAAHLAIALDNAIDFDEGQRLQGELREERDRLRLLLEVNNQEVAGTGNRLAEEQQDLEAEIRLEHDFTGIIGDSLAIKRVLQAVETVAPTDSTVLLRGETGTGKELLARALHDLSPRRERTFVRLSLAALPASLIESELFGYEKGAFTGATTAKIGRLELANRGTLFLDEVGDIPPDVQPKLLRALQEREFERLGSTQTQRVDVRLIAATNRDLEQMIADGLFRQDLYYRLNVFPIRVPALRDRPEDIPALVHHLLDKLGRRLKRQIPTVPAATMDALQNALWPGNIRELENVVERAVILSSGPQLSVPRADLQPTSVRRGGGSGPVTGHLRTAERELILEALRKSRGVIGGPGGAAADLGVKRTTLHSKMRKLRIRRPSF